MPPFSDPPPFPLPLSYFSISIFSLSREKGVHSSLGYNPSHILTKLRAPECPKALSLSARRPRVFTVGASSGRLIPHSSSAPSRSHPLLPTSIVNKRLPPWRPRRQLRLRQPQPSGSRRKAVSWRAPILPSTIRRTLSPSSLSRSVQLSRLPTDMVQC